MTEAACRALVTDVICLTCDAVILTLTELEGMYRLQ